MVNDIKILHENLIKLHQQLRDKTKKKYNRINPFYEDLFEWKERGEYMFGKNKNITVYNSCSIVGDVRVGANTWIGPFVSLDGSGGLKIGRFCSVSAAVHILSHDTARWALSGGKEDYEYASVEVGDYCFIGVGSVITKGVQIGNHCIVGSGAVVTKSFPDFSIIAGVPAKRIGNILIKNKRIIYDYNHIRSK